MFAEDFVAILEETHYIHLSLLYAHSPRAIITPLLLDPPLHPEAHRIGPRGVYPGHKRRRTYMGYLS